jgi:hypothetical protein
MKPSGGLREGVEVIGERLAGFVHEELGARAHLLDPVDAEGAEGGAGVVPGGEVQTRPQYSIWSGRITRDVAAPSASR